ncbi:hypothetical protein F2P81_019674 [Scophthalmus maximus]|uniref:Uncharacterized protein n=1 Tax=Scophthalmus maximus TaxID=52904 RepID=A0A6A4S688_SCOMX|nr:hypothetical protein F2P81_019674 [Scophthalmus maximus]
MQVELLQVVRDQLFFSGLSSEVQPLPPETTGPEPQPAAGFRSEGAVWFSGESTLSTLDSEVEELQVVRDQLFCSGLSSEVQLLPPETAGPEWKQNSGFRPGEAAGSCPESRGLSLEPVRHDEQKPTTPITFPETRHRDFVEPEVQIHQSCTARTTIQLITDPVLVQTTMTLNQEHLGQRRLVKENEQTFDATDTF